MQSEFATIILDLLLIMEQYSSIHDSLVVETFSYVVRNEMIDIGLFVWMMYDAKLLKKSFTCVEALLWTFSQSVTLIQTKTYLLNRFIKNMNFNQVNRWFDSIEARLDGPVEESYLSHNINPIQAGLLIIDCARNLEEFFSATKFRSRKIAFTLEDRIFEILKVSYT